MIPIPIPRPAATVLSPLVRLSRILGTLLLLLALWVPSTGALGAYYYGYVRTFNGNFPVPNAVVVLQGVNLDVTDANGYYEIWADGPLFGTTHLTWEKNGYFFDYDTFHYNVMAFLFLDQRLDFQIYVVPAPTLNTIATVNGTEDTTSTVNLAGIGRGDPDLPMSLAVTATSGNTALVPNPTVTYTSPNSTGSLTLNPVANATGSATITVTVTRQDGATVVRTFTYNVAAGNDGPTASPASSLVLDGVDDRMDLASLALANRSFSVELWAKRTEPGTWDMALFQGTGTLHNGLHIGFRPENGFTFAFYGNDLTTAAYTDSDWHHWACTYDASNRARKIYRDGVLVAQDIASAHFQGTGNVSLGDAPAWGSLPFKGRLADVRVWNVNRTAAEVADARHGSLPPNTPGLIANYQFLGAVGSPVRDAASSASNPDQAGAQDGTLINGATVQGHDATLASLMTIPISEDSPRLIYLPAHDIDSTLTYSAVTATFGTVVASGGSGAAAGTFNYTPPPGYVGPATINYTVTDGALTSSSSVTLQVQAVNDVPVVGPGTSIALNGANQYLDAPDGAWLGNTFTVEGWVFVRSHNNWSRFFDFGNGAPNNNVLGALSTGGTGQPSLHIYQGGTPQNITAPQPLPLNTWVHLAFTRDASGVGHIYTNGVEAVSGALWAPLNVTRVNNFFGASNWAGDAFANAKFAEIRIWNIARTQAEISGTRHASLAATTTGLIGLYRLNEGSGSTAYDGATTDGAQNLALISGPSWQPVDGPASSLAFNGTTQYAQRTDTAPLSITGPLTVEAWIRPAAIGTAMGIVEKYSGADGGYALRLNSAGRIEFFTIDASGNSLVQGGSVLPADVWTHVAGQWDGTQIRVFVNGLVDASAIVGRGPSDGSTPLIIGATGPSPYNYRFNGRIGDVRIWNMARTAVQIADWRGGVPANTPGLVANYKFNEGSGTILINATGDAAQNATLIGSPTWPAAEVNLPALELVRFTEDTPVNLVLPAFDIEGAALTYSGVTASTGTVAQVAGSLYAFTPPLNYNGPATITYTVTDGTSPITAKVYLQGTGVEDGPTIAAIPTQTVGEGSPTTSLGLSFTDGDPELTQALSLTATSSDPTLIRNPGIIYTSPAETAQLTYKPRPGRSGTATITVVVTDVAASLTATQSFNIVVTAVDDPPNVGPATALQFNGPGTSGNYARIPGFGNSAPQDEITIEFWQFVNAVVGQSTFMLNPDSTANRINAHVPWSNGQVFWDFGNLSGNVGRLAYTPPVSIAGSWQHFAFVASKSGNYMKIFRNGIEEATKPGMSSFVPVNSDLTLGRFAGQLAEFRIWRVARTAPEIRAAMHASVANGTADLVAYYRFNQRPTTVLTDFASAPAQSGAQDGELISDAAENDPIWQTTTSSQAWQSSDPALAAKQIVRIPDGTTTNLFLPAWDAENGLALTWQSVSASTGSVAQVSGGLWAYTAPIGYDGPATLSYSVKDTANQVTSATLNLRVVIAQNDPPTIAAIPNAAAEENSSLIEIPFTVNDDQPASALVITPVVLANADLIQSQTVPPGGNFRTLHIVPKPGEIGTVHIRLLVQDAGGKTAETEFDLRIEPKPAFSVFDLGVLPGKSASFGTAINDRGAVTGFTADTADLESNPVGFFFNGIENGGVVENNPPVQVGPSPLSTPFRAWAINNAYDLAGAGRNGGQTVPWFKDIENPLNNLGLLPGGSLAEARALNEGGVLAGFGTLASGKKRAFRFAPGDGALTDLGTAPAPFNDQSEAFGLNVSNHLVGAIYATDGRRRAMVYTNGVMLPLFSVPNDTNSVAYGINTFDQVVGSATSFSVGDTALSFDGVDDYVAQANLLTNPSGTPLVAGNAAHSVEAWIRVAALPANRSWPLLLGNAATGSQHWLVNSAGSGGNLRIGFYNTGVQANIPTTLGAWMHVATTYDPPTSKFIVYVNGQPFVTNTIAGVNLQGIPLKLGQAQAAENFFNGGLDEVRIWRSTRTAAEIASNYTRRLTGNEPDLVVFFPFDEGSGTTSTASLDAGGLTASLSGSPTWTVRGGLPSPDLTVSDPVLQLDGVSSFATGPSLPLANTSFTLEFRARRVQAGQWDVAVGQGTNLVNRGLHVGFRPTDTFTFAFYGNDLNTTASYTDLDWHHWACTLNITNGTRVIYRDGVVVAQDTPTSAYLGSGPVVLGRAMFDSASWFNGLLDDVRVWNIARSAEDIAANLDLRLPGNTPGLLSSFTFDEGGGNTVANRTAGAGDAMLEGAIGWSGRDTGTQRAFLFDSLSGRLSSLGTVTGGGASEARAVNDFGQIVGTAFKGNGRRAFFHSAGQLHDLNDLLPEAEQLDQWTLESASGINRSGAIVGTGKHGAVTRAFLALPATVIGHPVIRPQGAVERLPLVTILKKHLPDDSAQNSFYWSAPENKLYAIRPVTARIDWFTSMDDTVGGGTELESNTNRIVSVTVNVWPKAPVIHIAGAPVDLQPALTAANYTFQYLIYVTNNAAVEPSAKIFTSPTPGYTVAYYLKTDGQPVNPQAQRPYFEVVRTVTWEDSHAALTHADWTIGSEVTEAGHREYDGKNGYVLFEKAAYDATGPDRAYNRGNRNGPILPVNTEKPGGNLTANPDPLLVVWYRTNRIGVAWASVPVKYSLHWPADDVVDRIIIASQLGSGFLSAADYPAKTIYNQPDLAQPGFNPNEEHAYLPVDTLYAIRNDLNAPNNFSEPYALLKYRDPSTSRWRMRVFQVVAEQAPYFFTYGGTVGKEIQPPLPLSLMPLCEASYLHPGDSEVGWEDYKGKIYARQAGPEGSHTNLVIRWFYPMQPGFFHPDPGVAVGDCLAWLDRRSAANLSPPNQGPGTRNRPIDVTYDIRWDDHQVLEIGETLIHSKHGLPDVFNMANARVIFDSLSSAAPGSVTALTRFYDPLSARTITTGVIIPASLKRQNIAGKEYFTDLPWMLKLRLSYDPINNWLSFSGYLDENFGVGEPLLLPNVLSARERDRLKQLAGGDGNWAALIDRLYDLTRNPNRVDWSPQDSLPDQALRLGLIQEYTTNFFEVSGARKVVLQIPARTVPGPFGEPIIVEPARETFLWWPEAHRPSNIEEARQIDAKLTADYRAGQFVAGGTITFDIFTGQFVVTGGGPPSSSFSITSNVLPEVLGAGPKALTAGLGGVPAAQIRPGRALNFDGSSGLVTIGPRNGQPLPLAGAPFTLEFWAKVTSPATEQYLLGQPDGAPDLGRLRIGFRDGGKFAFDLGTAPASISLFTTSDTYLDTGWHHWACAFDPETKIQTIFYDGAPVDSRTNLALTYLGLGPIELGRFGSQFFGGQLDEIRIWKTARTAAEIRGQMHKRLLGAQTAPPGGAGSELNLELLYRCDETAGPLFNASLSTQDGYEGALSGGVSLVTSDAPTGIPPRYITVAENNDPALAGLPVALHVIRIDDGPFLGDLKVLPGDNVFDERLTLRHSSDFGGDPGPLTFQWYYKPIGADFDPTDLPVVADPTAEFPSDTRGWTPYTNYQPQNGAGVNYVTTGEGGESGLVTLSDNAFICRYKGYAVNLNSAAAWSGWVGDPSGTAEQPRAALAEGWVKRVIRGLNPFDARTTDFHSSPAVTFASMLIQLGQRYEGPIAFNPSADAINKVGLIEAYTTVLERAKGLSIEGVPQVDFNPANNALLLAATKLSDFYVVLGNEAYADASDPTIGFGTSSREYGSIASSIFAFQNQLDSLLEEELALLRGRDDSAAGVGARPVYNRLFWNFTLGEGEVAYQQNYNISDQNVNGFIDDKDARLLYPQGHGDAWGHYLAALKQQYALLRHPFFTWVPRSELVNVAGAAVKVDFLDERKFAAAAAAKAKAGAEIVDLTYRLNYVDDPSGQWQGYKDTKPDRAWGVTEWSRRAGTGAYFDWLTGNTILPSTDPNPAHTGIDKIDRQTVRELQEIPAHFDEIQTRLDQADAGLNPLGLAKGVVPFDIDPSLVSGAAGIAGKTHYEQIQDRALKAMNNAMAVWDEVNKATQMLRQNQDSVETFTEHVNDQERDYKNRLIEIYGYPYAGDVGPGKTYPSSYDGPDLYHYMYVPIPDFDGTTSPNGPGFTAFFTRMGLGASPIVASGNTQSGALGSKTESFFFPADFASDLENPVYGLEATNRILAVNYPTTTASYAFTPPASWGQRRAPGELQMALSDLIQTEARLRAALKADDALLSDIADRIGLLNARYGLRADQLTLKNDLSNTKIALTTAIIAAKIAQKVLGGMATTSLRLGDIAADGFPKVVGFANDVTSAGRVSVRLAALAVAEPLEKAGGIIGAVGELTEKVGLTAAEAIVASKIEAENFDYEIQKQVDELERVIHQEGASRLEGLRLAEMVRQASGRYLAALAKGQRLLEERVTYRTRVAARTTESRYQDMTFRIFRNDALQKYRATFDLAQRYVFLAATAYDYEANLLGTDTRGGRAFLTDIIRQRSLGQMLNGAPVVGRAGLADPLARMGSNFDVLKTQLGFNNPQTETGRFSLRNELFRLRGDSDDAWKTQLQNHLVPNLWDIPEFRRYCRSFAPESAGPQPGLVIRFPTTVTAGLNFFNWPLGGGDSAYDPSRFATKVRSAGVWFTGYNGLGLSQTPRVYLIPVGADVLSSPTPNDFATRAWRVVDQALPVPFPIGANRLNDPKWIPINDSLGGSFAEIRRFASFRAYHDSGDFNPSEASSDSRLIGRSVWNTDWMLVIPGQTFLANPATGLDTFIHSVSDIKLFFQTYSYSGN